ncbi:hypothetical protein BATDEDRAFT_33372 [Batrachochytrium dendrobatidis JAM81]|uniref:NTF2 domain-containing protein n=1 Tax=Batrachochytrium dendrobatidis (strain JAM81 / FGSC 10211) TaxID=684364 RepID=F4P5I2_BATDJ|nr:uncharacterized protein BATDEDRAFT_33372 [Batrachochytrium dendrobatidis JAM81]EGF79421.1 hypothetical protein BATDEDRAFT_33372 [Batrachochytrium dendrobatidis JAM81]KAJ8322685.1 hypothetical protein O5D80_008227 [Batrachochytrium dendrobatidis]KAK5666058.1 hypothetical protein QVD99_007670 [Batrachochytrium dendrobatidis]|eukprot:XP_006679963.1 hypothetical protein BATDEDRAFT_33372 [Batrachochytrium dendrobatidis JAM81]
MTAASTITTALSENKVDPFEVGWLFVQEYYTFLNKDPERLHCFYNKKSVFVHGTEGDNTETCYGQSEIHRCIMSFNFDSCKVLISSVDSQASHDDGVLVQVLGEMSNNGGASHKFAQTFFLAVQPNGYFVMNDIFRFLKEDIDNVYEESEDPVEEQTFYTAEHQSAVSQRSPSPAHVPAVTANVAATTTPSKTHNVETVAVTHTETPADVPVVVAPTTTANARASSPARVKQAFTDTKSAPAATTSIPQPATAAQPIPASKTKETHKTAKPVDRAPAAAPTSVATAAPVQASASPKRIVQQAPVPAPAPVPATPSTWAKMVGGSDASSKSVSTAIAPQRQSQTHTPASVHGSAQQVQAAVDSSAQSTTDSFGEEDFHQVTHGNRQGRQRNHNTTPHEEYDRSSIYLRSLPAGIESATLDKAFSIFGAIRNIEINQGKRTAFIEFVSNDVSANVVGKSFTFSDTKVTAEGRRKPTPGTNRNNNPRGSNGGFSRNNNSTGSGTNRGRGGYQNNRPRGQSNATSQSTVPANFTPSSSGKA